MTMKRIFADIRSGDLSEVSGLQEMVKKEVEAVTRLKEQGVLEHTFVKSGGQGAVLIFKGLEEGEVRKLVSKLPMAPYFSTVEYTIAEKRF